MSFLARRIKHRMVASHDHCRQKPASLCSANLWLRLDNGLLFSVCKPLRSHRPSGYISPAFVCISHIAYANFTS